MKNTDNIQYTCPVCNSLLKEEYGNQLHPGDKEYGIVLYCANKECTAAEVSGHGDNVKQAFEVITSKFNRKEKE